MNTPIIHVACDAGRSQTMPDETKDCAVRSVATALGLSYIEAHKRCKLHGRPDKRGMKIAHMKNLLGNPRPVRRHGTVARFLRDYPNGRFLVWVSGHFFAVIDGRIYDQNPARQESRRVKAAWPVAAPAA